jgi:uncharacterized protein YraI
MSRRVRSLMSAAAAVVAALGAGLLQPPNAEAASKYGCFTVTTEKLNIRARPYSDAAIIGTASAGDILEKRKLFCTPRGFWCAVRKGKLEGYADKNFLGKVSCP